MTTTEERRPAGGRAAQVTEVNDPADGTSSAALDAVMRVLSGLDPAVVATALSLLPPADPVLVAARVGVEVADLRLERRRAMREASQAISRALDWRQYANRRVPHNELQRRRGVEVGPDGGRRSARRDDSTPLATVAVLRGGDNR